jgi:hypothetical protein
MQESVWCMSNAVNPADSKQDLQVLLNGEEIMFVIYKFLVVW